MKMLRFLLSAVMLVALLAGMQLTAHATLASPADDEVSRIARENEVDLIANDETSRIANENETSLHEASQMPTVADIYPISANPDTGAENLAIPAVVALLAASTAAIALSSKKK